ncbi:MAG: cation transporter, partial [Putridiphycobacter sp.]|nr:cation transporter [Putridiphycobacter sp.]
LIAGVLLAAMITNLIPASLFENYLTSPLLNMLIILIASIPLYVCATASVPIASALLLVGVSPGAVLVFLMAGPATNIATITVLWRSLGKKSTIAYLVAIVLGAFSFGFLIDYVLPTKLFSLLSSENSSHVHDSENWTGIGASIILILLILFVEIKKLIPGKMAINNTNQTQYIVEGMTCNHCKASVEKNIGNLKGITFSEVDLSSKTLTVQGDVSESDIASKISDLGYTFKGKANH